VGDVPTIASPTFGVRVSAGHEFFDAGAKLPDREVAAKK